MSISCLLLNINVLFVHLSLDVYVVSTFKVLLLLKYVCRVCMCGSMLTKPAGLYSAGIAKTDKFTILRHFYVF